MRVRTVRDALAILNVVMLLPFLAAVAHAADAPRMDPAELKEMLGKEGLAIVDVRLDAATATTRIPGSVIEDSAAYAEWSKRYPKDRTIVLYCS
ncbi:MAG TPA: rhodanese-like domain-containing protein [Candidatus Methylomirabilis sp.]|nr:rhodanese-like domain-containing protein [Candidatus Methylomirabilis sp.]